MIKLCIIKNRKDRFELLFNQAVVFTSVIHSHVVPNFSWCFLTDSLSGASTKQNNLSSLL
ncbi:hypothetical protein NARC_160007 [Candidatus Nitrosocosmicus arcticus]|uniref:Uncharacterized protein n=1 Tax=Candidatus Nitrosocosmicus arcticus TaxID=2035267 RepID=A0A557SRR2_9ARCH|nr:hypothetical protein NARC_160007 [Candidatus Nitrosocosmicus arcticus]